MADHNHKDAGVVSVYIEDEVKKSYLDYAMSVIVGRALPDVRDGLKPVQRRILYSMFELGLDHNRPFKKSATVVGDVLGKYHPHGDMAIYDTLVRMAQNFSLRYPLVDGQGNFGSVDGDAAAAYRYTEARLTPLAEELLSELDKATVDFNPNFDGRLKEPVVLPARFPNLLLNGVSGIAVGMATNIPPHNFSELVDGLVRLIEKPDTGIAELNRIVTGPDFPTGGIIIGRVGIQEAYKTGRGRLVVRGRVRLEETKAGKTQILITEIPYQVNKSTLIERIAALVKEKKIEGVSDLRDESDRDGMRIAIDLKRDAVAEIVLNQLYHNTPLQSTFGIILLALVDNTPKVLNLKELLTLFLDFRHQTVFRRSQFQLKQASDRAHILEGLKIALKNLDAVIALIKSSKDPEAAKTGLMKRFKLSEIQAQAILDMKLARLTNLEQAKINEEYLATIKEIARLEELLASKKAMMVLIKEELIALKKRFGDERRTEIIEGTVEELKIEDLIADEDVIVTITRKGYIKRMPVSVYRRQDRGAEGKTGIDVADDDFVAGLVPASTHDYLLFFSDKGRAYWLKVYEIPEGSHNSKGRPIVNLVELEKEERISSYLAVREFSADRSVFMVTRRGTVKKTSLAEFANPRKKGIAAIKLDRDDELIDALMTDGKDEIMLVTRLGRALRFKEKLVREMGRSASGVRGIKLGKNDAVINGTVIRKDESILVITENGFGKRSGYSQFGIKGRGGMGMACGKVSDKSGALVKAQGVQEKDEVIIITKTGAVIRLKVSDVKLQGRATIGNTLITLKENDRVVDLARVETEA